MTESIKPYQQPDAFGLLRNFQYRLSEQTGTTCVDPDEFSAMQHWGGVGTSLHITVTSALAICARCTSPVLAVARYAVGL